MNWLTPQVNTQLSGLSRWMSMPNITVIMAE
jgi:hypothetical protein